MPDTTLTRRGLLGIAAAETLRPAQAGYRPIDFHAHVDAAPSLDGLFEIARKRGVGLGVVEHAGDRKQHRYRGLLGDDAALSRYLDHLKGRPCFTGIQAEGLDWMGCFSKAAIARLDYVLTDALTFPETDGSLVRLWTPAARVENKQDFMERYTAHHLKVIATEPIDILANPLYLPERIEAERESLWTDERMQRIVRAAVKNNVAFEINSRFRLPGVKFLKMAKAAGSKFSLGSNVLGAGVADIEYGRAMVRELGLERSLFMPAPQGKKPIEIRRFA